jgi:S1-C subfamily serine protease
MESPVHITVAGLHESGVVCPHCRREIAHGEKTVQCSDCGDVQHWSCWSSDNGCGSYDCCTGGAGQSSYAQNAGQVLKITPDDVQNAVPMSLGIPGAYRGPAISIPVDSGSESDRWNRLAIVSFVVALLGIPLFGIVTGLVAVTVGGLALAGRNSMKRRGVGLAAAGILLGIADFVGWAIVLFQMGGLPGVGLAMNIDEFEPDPVALEALPDHLNRAMMANVLIQVQQGVKELWGSAIGSGVILRIANGSALIVTNRHVVDSNFPGSTSGETAEPGEGDTLRVKLVGQPNVIGKIVWIASGGIDLALIQAQVNSDKPLAAWWDVVPNATLGDSVFAVGNPHGLGWTLTRGDVSQLRRQNFGGSTLRVVQTSAAINPGNSGGGLYDESGHLIGINTWTRDKRFAEGLGFAISFQELLPLVPDNLDLPDSQLESNKP